MIEEDRRMVSTIKAAAVALILVATAFVVVTVLVVGAGASNNVSLVRSTALLPTAVLSVGFTVVGTLVGGFFVIRATTKAREDIYRALSALRTSSTVRDGREDQAPPEDTGGQAPPEDTGGQTGGGGGGSLANLGDLGNLDLGPITQYLPNLNFPASKDEVISEVQNNDAPQEVVNQIRNASTDTFNNPDEVLQVVQGRS